MVVLHAVFEVCFENDHAVRKIRFQDIVEANKGGVLVYQYTRDDIIV